MVNAVLGKKIEQKQMFLKDGTRIPVTIIDAGGNVVVATHKNSLQLGFGIRKRAQKSIIGHVKKAGLEKAPRFFREVSGQEVKPGTVINISEVLKQGDLVDVTGVSKGKGFAGVVKRHHFKGGPRTHGQSDRERAPGSIGQTTTPGRVYKGKRMAGHMGASRATIKNLQVVDVVDNQLVIKGLVPGARNSLVVVNKIGQTKKFIPLYKQSLRSDELKEETNAS